MHIVVQDFRFAARKLARTPGFTAVAVLSLALAIGSVTAIVSIVNSVLLQPLPFAHPERLAFIESTSPDAQPMPASPQDLLDYVNQSRVFTDVAAIDAGEQATLTRDGMNAQRVSEARVGATMFSILGVTPAAGRYFVRGEDAKNAPKVAVLSYRAWREYFGGDAHIVGRSIVLDGNSFMVVGIASPGVTYPGSPDVWVPAVWRSFEIGDDARGYHAITGVGRLAPGSTIASARQALGAIAARLAIAFPRHDAKVGAFVQPLQEQLVGDVGPALYAMLGAVAFVLLIACANVANLLLVRAAAREAEFAVRAALGATRRQIVRQLVTEGVLLSGVGALLGILFAAWAVSAVVRFGPQVLPRVNEIAIDWRVIVFTVVLALVVGVLFGLAPALHSARADSSNMLRAGSRGLTSRTNRTRSVLVLSEIVLATVLLIAAGLLIRSFERLTRVDPGFRPEHLVVFDVSLPEQKYQYDAEQNAFATDVMSRLAALPGTENVAVTATRPLNPDHAFAATTSFTVQGDPKPAPGTEPEARVLSVSPSYFSTLGIPMTRGRALRDADDRLRAPQVVVINEALASKYFPNENPIGRRLTFGLSHTVTANPADSVRMGGEIVGVAKNSLMTRPGEPAEPQAYFAYATAPFAASFVLRTGADPSMVQGSIRRLMHDVDPNVAVYQLGTMGGALADSIAQPRFYTILLGCFGAIALLLAALGIFGVISYVVSQRTREFGIRIALGATARDVSRSVVRRGLVITSGGIVIGAIVAAGLTRTIQSLLYGTDALDVPTFVAVTLLLGAVATMASWLPARRAARTDPTIAMRAD